MHAIKFKTKNNELNELSKFIWGVDLKDADSRHIELLVMIFATDFRRVFQVHASHKLLKGQGIPTRTIRGTFSF